MYIVFIIFTSLALSHESEFFTPEVYECSNQEINIKLLTGFLKKKIFLSSGYIRPLGRGSSSTPLLKGGALIEECKAHIYAEASP